MADRFCLLVLVQQRVPVYAGARLFSTTSRFLFGGDWGMMGVYG